MEYVVFLFDTDEETDHWGSGSTPEEAWSELLEAVGDPEWANLPDVRATARWFLSTCYVESTTMTVWRDMAA